MRSVRIRFAKTGSAKYMSHLDLNRLMLRLIKKSRLPVWYTEGFNPHAYITFALPLPLGHEGLNESMDLRIEGEVSNEEIGEKLSAVLPPGFAINRVYDLADAPKTIAFALYEIELSLSEGQNADSVALSFNELVKDSKLTALKTAKKGRKRIEKEVELNPLIAEFEACSKEGKV
ncbi:MAG TPA: TIGR03936 family radical SAM-associated protein, partial [Oscillospiraceae bacterium]|nr:TIGR03936 family radical SAM-associated protein [Oscillospiraceae bacterium]